MSRCCHRDARFALICRANCTLSWLSHAVCLNCGCCLTVLLSVRLWLLLVLWLLPDCGCLCCAVCPVLGYRTELFNVVHGCSSCGFSCRA